MAGKTLVFTQVKVAQAEIKTVKEGDEFVGVYEGYTSDNPRRRCVYKLKQEDGTIQLYGDREFSKAVKLAETQKVLIKGKSTVRVTFPKGAPAMVLEIAQG